MWRKVGGGEGCTGRFTSSLPHPLARSADGFVAGSLFLIEYLWGVGAKLRMGERGKRRKGGKKKRERDSVAGGLVA